MKFYCNTFRAISKCNLRH